MIADTPTRYIPQFGSDISLPQYLDYVGSGAGWGTPVTGYHITQRDNVSSILSTGLHAGDCARWMSDYCARPSAVYLFCDHAAAVANIRAISDDPDNVVILAVTIPAKCLDALHIDNIYNMAVDAAAMTAIQYRDNIPPEWITP